MKLTVGSRGNTSRRKGGNQEWEKVEIRKEGAEGKKPLEGGQGEGKKG